MNKNLKDALDNAKELEQLIKDKLEKIKNLGIADGRWLAIATTDMEKGLLALNHSLNKIDLNEAT